MDTADGYVEHVEVHPANQAEVNKLPGIVDALEAQGVVPVGVLADKGYASAANRDRCITAPANAPTTAIPAHFRMRKESVDFSVF